MKQKEQKKNIFGISSVGYVIESVAHIERYQHRNVEGKSNSHHLNASILIRSHAHN